MVIVIIKYLTLYYILFFQKIILKKVMFILDNLKQFNIDMNDQNIPYLVYLCLHIFVLSFI